MERSHVRRNAILIWEPYIWSYVVAKGRWALKSKWVYGLKTEQNNSKWSYKAGKGYNQKKGIDFEEIFSLVVKMSLMRVVLDLATSLDLEIEQLDAKTTFLHGDQEEEICMEHLRDLKLLANKIYYVDWKRASMVSNKHRGNGKKDLILSCMISSRHS